MGKKDRAVNVKDVKKAERERRQRLESRQRSLISEEVSLADARRELLSAGPWIPGLEVVINVLIGFSDAIEDESMDEEQHGFCEAYSVGWVNEQPEFFVADGGGEQLEFLLRTCRRANHWKLDDDDDDKFCSDAVYGVVDGLLKVFRRGDARPLRVGEARELTALYRLGEVLTNCEFARGSGVPRRTRRRPPRAAGTRPSAA
jgi:hypothetical protein